MFSLVSSIPENGIRRGASGPAVVLLQQALTRAGFSLLADGDYGGITQEAVKAFQRRMGVEDNGIVGKWIAGKLQDLPPVPVVPAIPVDLIYCDLLYGLGDASTSAGMDVLAAGLRARNNRLVVAPTVSWSRRAEVVARIQRRPKSSLNMLFGNSMGANAIPMITNACPDHRFILIGGYDPTIWWACPAFVGRNVERGILYNGRNWLNPIGHARYTEAFAGQIEVVPTSTLHGGIDDDVSLHRHTFTRVDQVASLFETKKVA